MSATMTREKAESLALLCKTPEGARNMRENALKRDETLLAEVCLRVMARLEAEQRYPDDPLGQVLWARFRHNEVTCIENKPTRGLWTVHRGMIYDKGPLGFLVHYMTAMPDLTVRTAPGGALNRPTDPHPLTLAEMAALDILRDCYEVTVVEFAHLFSDAIVEEAICRLRIYSA